MEIDSKIWFRSICRKNGLTPSDVQIEQMEQYVHLLLDWNKKINLISRKDEANIWSYHILHSVSPLFRLSIAPSCTMIDIGTGGGLPGVPIKILRSDISLLCLDATNKKIHALTHMIEALNLSDARGVWGRAEEIGQQAQYLHHFDYVIARAVCPLDELVSLASKFLRKKNYTTVEEQNTNTHLLTSHPPAIIALKGGDLKQEVDRAQRKFPRSEITTINLTFSGSDQLVTSDKKIILVHL
jgi:16S rRNA (guanine527-N7)-methyltransferase